MSNPASGALPGVHLRDLNLPAELVEELEQLNKEGGWTTSFGKVESGSKPVEPTVEQTIKPYSRRLNLQ